MYLCKEPRTEALPNSQKTILQEKSDNSTCAVFVYVRWKKVCASLHHRQKCKLGRHLHFGWHYRIHTYTCGVVAQQRVLPIASITTSMCIYANNLNPVSRTSSSSTPCMSSSSLPS